MRGSSPTRCDWKRPERRRCHDERVGPNAAKDLRVVARRFLGEAFNSLEREHVLPAPTFAPHVRVGRDYFGDTIRSTASYAAFEAAIEAVAPRRFEDAGTGLADREFANSYVFAFIDAAIYLCTVDGGGYSATSRAVSEAIDMLLTSLVDPTPEVAVCRAVTHLTTASEETIALGGITVTPAVGWDALREIGRQVPGAGSALTRDPPFVYDPPGSVLTIRGSMTSDPYRSVEELSSQLERFLIAIRLVTGASVQSAFEVRGATTRVSRIAPYKVDFHFSGSLGALIRRTARLAVKDEGSLTRVVELLGTAERRKGVLISSFDMALSRYNRSHQSAPWTDKLVDLATALEAALIGTSDDNSSVVVRLRHRAATLLVADNDESKAINADLKLLYDLRSTLVHGGDLTDKQLKKMLRGVSTIPAETPAGVAAELAVDRLRDLVRRSILARLSLGTGTSPLWPLDKPVDVDAVLLDDASRKQWREAWQAHVTGIAGDKVTRRARRAVESVTADYAH